MSKFLFDEFEAVSAKQWKQKIQAELKGEDYNDTLVWKTNEDIHVKPFYTKDDRPTDLVLPHTQASSFKICQRIYVANTEAANKKATDIIERGAESLLFVIPTEEIDITTLLNGIDSSKYILHFEMHFVSSKFIQKIKSHIKSADTAFFHNDIIGSLTSNGNWFQNLKADFTATKQLLTEHQELPNLININTTIYHNAGATMVQQLAYALAHANEYLHFAEKQQLSLKKQQITFSVAVGGNYFFEIAKLRALRMVWEVLAREYDVENECHIIATPAKRNKTIYDYNVNMLRTTSECMSAILGGANTIYNLPYDALYHKDNEFGERISRNQLLILKNESYFSAVNNPADGAYYIESLTHQLAEKALALFKEIEASGGFLKQLKEGVIQRKIKESAAKEQAQYDAGELALVGTNKQPNLKDLMKDDIELYPFVKTKSRKTLIEPIIERRLAGKLEKERLDAES
jgi:methylmalonyl-CoA mutase